MTVPDPSIQPVEPPSGLAPLELAKDLLSRIDRANSYAKSRKQRFRSSSVVLRLISMSLLVSSTIILGLQNLGVWASIGFALVATVTVVNTLEPFFAWRSRWVLMEESQHQFYRLHDELTFYIAATPTAEIDPDRIRAIFDEYQQIWDQLGTRWLEFRRSPTGTQ